MSRFCRNRCISLTRTVLLTDVLIVSSLCRVNIDALKVAEARLVEERRLLEAVVDELPVSVVMAAAPPSGAILLRNRQTLAVWRRNVGFFSEGAAASSLSVLDGSYYDGIAGCVLCP